jgi:uncharacterized protein (DUF608 family)
MSPISGTRSHGQSEALLSSNRALELIGVACVCIRARAAYIGHLWNGKYFRYDASTSFHNNR